MKRLLAAGVLAAACLGVLPSLSPAQAPAPAVAPAAKQQTVPVKVVVLFSSGVGYFEHIGSVKGDAATELSFKTNQINDLLKSLVLQDTQGKVGAVVYPSQDPIAKTLRSFQVDITSNPSLAELLNQLRGAKVTVAVGTETVSATILGCEQKPKSAGPDKPPVNVWFLNLIAGGTIRTVPLDEVNKLDIEDPVLREELKKALEALAKARDQDKKPVTINFAGEGERLVRIGYVVETPIWKTSYRLIMAPKPGDKSNIQGWAIVENQTDNDWENVQLSLVSGRPISFIQELYQPLYIPRPVVVPELFASLRPQTYEGGMEKLKKAELAEARDGTELRRNRAGLEAAKAMPAAPPGLAGRSGGFGGGGGGMEMDRLAQLADKPMDAGASVASVASASKAGELFQYTVGAVSLPRQKSAMIPIITDPVEVEKLSIYNPAVMARHPLNGAKVKNTTKKHLLQGPVTVLEANTYAGDASIDNVPPGQERLISYGIDLQVVANASKNTNQSTIVGGKVVKGVMHLKRKNVFTQEYAFENKGEAEKNVVVEHAFRHGWKLVAPEKTMETTERLYRFKLPVEAGKSATLPVKEELVQSETLAILTMDVGTMDWYAKSGEISQPVRDAFAKAASLRRSMEDANRLVQKHRNDINVITQEQVRIRENIKTVPDKSAYQTRLLQKLEEQEKQIEGLYTAMDAAQKQSEARRKELEDYLTNLNVGE